MTVSTDPVECLAEIAKIAMDRTNRGDATSREMFALGKITGIASRIPEVMRRLKEMEEEE